MITPEILTRVRALWGDGQIVWPHPRLPVTDTDPAFWISADPGAHDHIGAYDPITHQRLAPSVQTHDKEPPLAQHHARHAHSLSRTGRVTCDASHTRCHAKDLTQP